MQQYVMKGRKGWLKGDRDHLQIKIFYFLSMKKHREKAKSTGKTQGKHREFCLDGSVATLVLQQRTADRQSRWPW